MNHTVGDSHAKMTFDFVRGVTSHHLGPITMKRAGHEDDPLIPETLARIALSSHDVVIFCFGEIDVRCHLDPMVRDGVTATQVLEAWTSRYLNRLATLDTRGARKAVLGLPPPTTLRYSFNKDFPVAGTTRSRVGYVREANRLLAAGCAARGFIFIDIYTPFTDPWGSLNRLKSDDSVHISDPVTIASILARAL